MEKKLNYPVKYAVLELKTKGGFIHNFEDITVGFIASKCYVVNQNVRYFEDGASKVSYQVVFPYNDIHNYKWRSLGGFSFYDTEITPSFGYHGDCVNANVVSFVYDSFDEAVVEADAKNSGLKSKIGGNVSVTSPDWHDKYLEGLRQFEKDIDACKKYEQIIGELTSDMAVTVDDVQIKQFGKKKND